MARSSISVTTDGRALKRLDRKFAVDLPKAIARELRAQMPKIGMDFVAQARLLVPVRSGELRDAISYRVDSGGLAVNLFVDGSKLKIPMNAIWQEFGTQRAPAQSYWFASWRIKKRSYKARIKRAAKKGAKSI